MAKKEKRVTTYNEEGQTCQFGELDNCTAEKKVLIGLEKK